MSCYGHDRIHAHTAWYSAGDFDLRKYIMCV
eukprot:COSAG06_NODE_37581_length_433_cov_1.230539_1_plen_30_part_01